jgi:hypothetical protein
MPDQHRVHRPTAPREAFGLDARLVQYRILLGVGRGLRARTWLEPFPGDIDAPIPYSLTELGRADLRRWRERGE